MNKIVLSALLLVASSTSFAADEEVRLVYPTEATVASRVDSTIPQRRAQLPVAEKEEIDPMTPIGQVNHVLNALATLEDNQVAIASALDDIKKKVGSGQVDRTDELLDKLDPKKLDLSKLATTDDSNRVRLSVESLAAQLKATDTSLAEISKKFAAIDATLESIKTAKSATTIVSKRSKWIDGCIIAIVVLILLQIVGRLASAAIARYNDLVRRAAEQTALNSTTPKKSGSK